MFESEKIILTQFASAGRRKGRKGRKGKVNRPMFFISNLDVKLDAD